MDTFNKQTADELDYSVNYSRWLSDGDVVLLASDPVIEPPGELVATRIQYSDDRQIVKVFLAGGVDGSKYKVTVTAQTAGGCIKEVEFVIRVKDL